MAEEAQEGRNLSMEVDAVRGKLNEMSRAQISMEETLRSIRDALNLVGLSAQAGGGPSSSVMPQPDGIGHRFSGPEGEGNVNQLDPTRQVIIPVGEGYLPRENPRGEDQGPTRHSPEQPQGYGQPARFQTGNSQVSIQADRAKEMWMERMEEKIKSIQGPSTYGSLGIDELCPTTDVAIPKDFKIPDFNRYDGSTNPLLHLKAYCTKMAIWSKDERFLISFFHESLSGPALEWYIQLDHSKICCWKDLADVFMGQYRFNLDTAPTREQLGILQKRSGESFKQYAQRWRALAAQVQPPLTLSEMCSYFLGTLGSPYVGAMAGAAYRDFADLITAGERIEILMKAGKLPMDRSENNLPNKGSQPKKKDTEVNQVHYQPIFTPQDTSSYLRPPYPYQTPQYRFNPFQAIPNTTQTSQFQVNHIPSPQPRLPNRPVYNQYPPTYPQNRPNYQARPNHHTRTQNLPPFPKLSISNADLFQRLFDAHLLSENPVRPMEPPFPAWYNPNLTCKYHMGVTGHSIEDCEAFKTAVRKLIACGRLDIQEEKGPNIVDNPMPNHGKEKVVNVIGKGEASVREATEIHTPMKKIFESMKMAGYMPTTCETNEYAEGLKCAYHNGAVGHDLENCQEFKAQVQSMLMRGIIQVGKRPANGKEVSMVERFVLRIPPIDQPAVNEKVVITMKKPEPFAFEDTHAVPWNYDPKIEVVGSASKGDNEEMLAKNLMAVGGITRSGRCYGPEEVEKETKQGGEEKFGEKEKRKDEEEEFLKIMKQSEYDMIDQLKKTPARISLLSLILTSEPHRKALMKVLEEAYVKPNVTPQNVISMVDPVKHVSLITFCDEEIACPSEKSPHALHITVRCKGYVIAKVLIDGGSALNVLPMSTLTQLSMGMSDLTPQTMTVQAFDGTRRNILGEIILPVEIGPSKFQILFQVMEIGPAYTMLLGRPWIHEAGAVPSTLHQRVKYIKDGAIITVKGEEEIMVSRPVSMPFVDCAAEVEGNLGHSLEMVVLEDVTRKELTTKDAEASNVNQVVARMMAKNGYEEGKGLGSQLQGEQLPVAIPVKKDKFGLGYEGSIEGVGSLKRYRSGRKQPVPHLKENFPEPAKKSVHVQADGPRLRLCINTLNEEKTEVHGDISIAADLEPLKNWQLEPIVDVVALK